LHTHSPDRQLVVRERVAQPDHRVHRLDRLRLEVESGQVKLAQDPGVLVEGRPGLEIVRLVSVAPPVLALRRALAPNSRQLVGPRCAQAKQVAFTGGLAIRKQLVQKASTPSALMMIAALAQAWCSSRSTMPILSA